MKNPHEKTIVDQVSGVEVPNDRYTDWQEGYEQAVEDITQRFEEWANERITDLRAVLGYSINSRTNKDIRIDTLHNAVQNLRRLGIQGTRENHRSPS